PYAAWAALGRFSIGLGAFVVAVSYPWRTRDPAGDGRPMVFARLLLTLIAGGVLLACLGLLSELAGNGSILWVTGVPASSERVSGPFVNPNHFAAWLEMVIPATVAYVLVVMDRVRRRLGRAAHAARGRGMHPRQAWVSALIVHQRRLWAPLAACAGLLLMALAHVASGSWLHAFRPYQAPPVEGGIWDHAHNDYLELAAEGGLAGVALVLLFALALVRAAARRPAPAAPVAAPSPDRERSAAHSREFELP